MKQGRTRLLVAAGAIALTGIAGWLLLRDPLTTWWLLRSGQGVIAAPEAVYAWISFDELIAQADLIVIGRVAAISEPFWNQDSGEFYLEADGAMGMLLHTVSLTVTQTLVGDPGSDPVVVTVIGNRPGGPSAVEVSGGQLGVSVESAHDLEMDDEGVFFLHYTDLAWRDGTRPVVYFMGYPGASYLLLGEDGLYHGGPEDLALSLDELVQRIGDLR